MTFAFFYCRPKICQHACNAKITQACPEPGSLLQILSIHITQLINAALEVMWPVVEKALCIFTKIAFLKGLDMTRLCQSVHSLIDVYDLDFLRIWMEEVLSYLAPRLTCQVVTGEVEVAAGTKM